MSSKRAPLAEAVSRTIKEIERKYGAENPELVGKIRSRILLRLSESLVAPKSRIKVISVKQ